MRTRSILLALFVLASPLALTRCSSSGSGGSASGQGTGTSGGEQTGNQGNNDTQSLDDAGTLAMMDSGVGSTMATDAGGTAVIAADAGTAPSTLGQDFPIAPLHLAPTAGAHNADAQVDVELRADGSIYSHGQLLGQLSGRRVVSPSGREILAIGTDGTVSLGGTATRVRFREEGDVLMPTGAVLSITDDGIPVAIAPDQQRQQAPAHIIGFRGDLRRTAALLAVIAATVAMH